MQLSDLQFLMSQKGRALLEELAQEPITAASHLGLASKIREQVGQEEAHALLETALLRQRAARKFSRASEMYFTRQGLEQASAEEVSSYRARRFEELGCDLVADLGCGIGGDAISLTAAADVIGVDWDPVRLVMAQENVQVYERQHRFRPLQSDLLELKPLDVRALFCDPGRRDEHGRRIYSVKDYQPPLEFLDAWLEQAPNQCVKIGPGVSYRELPEEAEIEFISVKGEVREGVVWRGDLRTQANRRATLLPGAHSMTSDDPGASRLSEVGDYLVEPDGAVIRARLVSQLAQAVNGANIDIEIAYLTADKAVDTPFARFFPVEAVLSFQLKRLRAYLRERNVGRLTIKKRGSPLDVEMLESQLRLKGEEQRIIFLTKARGEPVVVVTGDPVSLEDGISGAE